MKKKNVVTIGGGTGSFVLLSGLKKYPINLSAIVSMADDGGSTGVLRDELGVLPPGDVRQCLVALSDSSEILRELMNYRFEKGGLEGHSFGNLFLSALEKINKSFSDGVEDAAQILNVKGEVIPVTNENMRLQIRLKNGEILEGENHLDHNEKVRKIGVEKISLKRSVKANQKALDRIKKADFIVIGPGDHYGSILPNLLIRSIGDAIKNAKAKVIYNCKLTNKKGQTDNFDLDCYVLETNKYIGKGRIDYVIYNKAMPSEELIKKYERKEGKGVVVRLNEKKFANISYRVIKADLLSDAGTRINKYDKSKGNRSFIRHDSDKLARVLMKIINL
jgi:uncharacterized cofD-like protein